MQGKTDDRKHIVIGVSGGIAAFKSAALVSRLKKEGADVHVCMTVNACRFITPLTMETLSQNRVVTDTFSRETPFAVEHISLAKLADLIVVAPATANIIGKAANGIADDFLSTLLLAARSKIVFAPAMNTTMLHNQTVQENIQKLKRFGCEFISSGSGLLACGDVGDGRMAEPEEIAAWISRYFAQTQDMAGLKLLVTAGPTREKIDDVRYITNRSSGKMGYAIAAAAAKRGAEVTLVSGAKDMDSPKGVNMVPVESAADMYTACMTVFDDTDIVVKAAAVADYTPKVYLPGKMKKSGDLALELVRTKDILENMGKRKNRQILVGFAAEAADLEKNAKEKLHKKNLDIIAANDISRNDIGFGSDENAVTLYFADGEVRSLPKANKSEVANSVLDAALNLFHNRG